MTKRSVGQLEKELKRVVDYFLTEGELTWAEVIGTLEVVKLEMYTQMTFEPEEDDSEASE